MHLNTTDLIVIAVYFAVILAIGLIYTRRAGKSLDEYFLSGRSLPWWIVGTSMVATTFAADTPLLVTNIVRTNGVSGNWVWWAFLLSGMVTVFLYARLWRRSEVFTDMGFYELRYSGRMASVLRGFRAAYLGLIFNVIVMGNVTLAAIKIGTIMLGLNEYWIILICGVITLLYSCSSGLWGVVVTDLLLFFVAMVGAIFAAYYSLSHESIGGLHGLMTNGAISSKLNILPNFNDWTVAISVFLFPILVQWWSVWYPGAEPGGGGYVAQRMLASKDEKNSMLATLWFNIAHYGIRPWPWIIVALCSLLVYPDLASLKETFPNIPNDPNGVDWLKDDVAYPAMLTLLPHGIMGLVLASLAAAYMSTISTQLNWGASYLIEDLYKRFIVKNKEEKHYVFVARITTGVLFLISVVVAFNIDSAKKGFDILLTIGAGTGLIYMLRWFWWRINAWTEITAMIVSFSMAIYFAFYHKDHFPKIGLPPIPDQYDWLRYLISITITTAAWLLVTFITPKTKPEVLQRFYDKIQPLGKGWSRVVDTTRVERKEPLTPIILAIFLGCTAVYSALFSTGFFIYGNFVPAVMLALLALLCATGILRLLPKLNWRG